MYNYNVSTSIKYGQLEESASAKYGQLECEYMYKVCAVGMRVHL